MLDDKQLAKARAVADIVTSMAIRLEEALNPDEQDQAPQDAQPLAGESEHDSHVSGMSEVDAASMRLFLLNMGIPQDDNFLYHLRAFTVAMRIYAKRYPKYQDQPIRAMGAKGVLVQARTCVERLWTVFGPSTPPLRAGKVDDLDDAYDAMNYLAHFINSMNQRSNGEWTWDAPSS
jgi:hypothetical protein